MYLVNPLLSPLPIQSSLYAGSATRVLAHFMPWFDGHSHIDVGYLSNDSAVIKGQVQQLKARGCHGVVVDWYGPSNRFIDGVTRLLVAELKANGMAVSIMLDNGLMKARPATVTPTQYLIQTVLPYVRAIYWSDPSSYVCTRSGKFLTFEFGMEAQSPAVDWSKVVAAFPEMALLHRNTPGFSKPGAGAYPWLDSSTSSAGYLDNFYLEQAKHSSAVLIGSAWAGFDDSRAAWTKHRVVDRRNGQLWLDTLGVTNKRFSSSHQLEFLQLVTWNDYEEGTNLEDGIDSGIVIGCMSTNGVVTASIASGNLNMHSGWRVSVNDGPFISSSNRIDLKTLYVAPGAYIVRFMSVAKTFGISRVSPATIVIATQPPVPPLVWS
jgi:hypothetical protein